MTVIWIHPYCLSPSNAAFLKHPGAPALFVWDDEEILGQQWTLKRLLFIRECLEEMPVLIRRGNVVAEVSRFAAEHHATRIVSVFNPCPRIRRQAAALGAILLHEEPFVSLSGRVDLKRFSRYWAKVERKLLTS